MNEVHGKEKMTYWFVKLESNLTRKERLHRLQTKNKHQISNRIKR